jgi:hypothetical protein
MTLPDSAASGIDVSACGRYSIRVPSDAVGICKRPTTGKAKARSEEGNEQSGNVTRDVLFVLLLARFGFPDSSLEPAGVLQRDGTKVSHGLYELRLLVAELSRLGAVESHQAHDLAPQTDRH